MNNREAVHACAEAITDALEWQQTWPELVKGWPERVQEQAELVWNRKGRL